ncbi:uncharacterized protein LOC121858954 [Homarus americanus]|uniref:uncharacterized protein LOC121858954 n=1 Tax=Homarus americanus TaxID=6706 RepID=UPI001C457FF0|nr:uncharacterized protein LOC121858954 [Homarus americanus]
MTVLFIFFTRTSAECRPAMTPAMGNVNRVFLRRRELKMFLEVQGKDDLLSHFYEILWELAPEMAKENKFFDLKNDSAAKDQSYTKVSEMALRVILPYFTTYVCKSGSSTLLQIKSKSQNRLDVDTDIGCALSSWSQRQDESFG